MDICCVVVTYNRKELLKESLDAILNQTFKVKDIIVIDNNSTDGTKDYLIENNLINKVIYKKLSKNMGGAGGFYEGIKFTLDQLYDWVWIMDDDSIPTITALEELIKSLNILKEENVGFLCSKVVGPENEEMNIPKISQRLHYNGYPIWMKYLNEGIVEVKAATFVSLLVKFDAIKQVGLPWKDFFIWGDDIEYTLRLSKYYGNGYVIGKSIVIHKRIGAKNLSILEEENINRIKMYKYNYRNNILLLEYDNKKQKVLVPIGQIKSAFIVLSKSKKFKIKKFIVIVSSTLNGVFNLKLRKMFKNRMNV